jgi:hypothetical protein
MNTVKTYKPPPKKISSSSSSFIDWITNYESLVIFGGFGVVIMITIILTGIFQGGPVVRDNVLYNAFGSLMMGGVFIYLIFSFMGSQIVILGKPIDVGMIIYIGIVLFVIFVFGN